MTLKTAESMEGIIYPKPNHEPATYALLKFVLADVDKEEVDELIATCIAFEQ